MIILRLDYPKWNFSEYSNNNIEFGLYHTYFYTTNCDVYSKEKVCILVISKLQTTSIGHLPYLRHPFESDTPGWSSFERIEQDEKKKYQKVQHCPTASKFETAETQLGQTAEPLLGTRAIGFKFHVPMSEEWDTKQTKQKKNALKECPMCSFPLAFYLLDSALHNTINLYLWQ